MPLLHPVLQNGDTAVYHQQIEEGDFVSRRIHFGYVALGTAFRYLIPGGTDWVMALATVTLGVAGVFATYQTALRLSGSHVASVLSALSLLAVPAYVRGMLLPEVEVPLVATLALAFALFVHGQNALAGLAFGVSILVSPLAAFALPAFLLTIVFDGPVWKSLRAHATRLAVFGICALALYAPVVLIDLTGYVYGPRGLLGSARTAFDFARQSVRSLEFVRGQVPLLLPFYALGVLGSIRHAKPTFVFGLIVAGTCTVLGQRAGDVPAQLQSIVLFAPVIAVALSRTVPALRAFLALAAAACLFFAVPGAYAGAEREVARKMARQVMYQAMSDQSRYPMLFVGTRGWGQERVVNRLVAGDSYEGHMLSPRQLRRRCRALSRPGAPRFTIWLEHPRALRSCPKLLRRYRSVRKVVAGRRVTALEPI